MKQKIIKILKYSLFIVLIILLTRIDSHYRKKACIEKMFNLSFNGKVIDKYTDAKQHDYKFVKISNKGIENQEINLINDKSKLFEYLQKNDSVYKKTGDLKVKVYRVLSDSTFVINVFCM